MREYEFAECCRELSYRLNLDSSDTLRVTGAFVRGEKVGLLFNEDFDEGIDVYIDLGHPENAGAELEIFRELLNINLELSSDRGESFGFHVESRHVVFRSFFRSEEMSPERLTEGILDYVLLVQELRTGPLSALVRPNEQKQMNVKPYTPRSQLTSGIVQRNASDVVQNVGRGLAMGMVNAVLSPKNLVHKIRGQESKIRWLSIRSNHETRVSMRTKRAQLITQAASEESHGTVSLARVMQALENMGFGEHQRLDHLQEFDADDPKYFVEVKDPSIMEPEFRSGIRINRQGQRLLAEYYARKYGANIVFPEDERGTHLTMADFFAEVRRCIEPLQKEEGDVRCAFYLGGTHTVPVIYIKEKGRQSILVADSKGGGDQDLARAISEMLAGEDITIYRVDEPRQRDMYSCYADAMKFAVIMTGREPLGGGTFGEYLLPSIGDELEARTKGSRYSGNVSAVILPIELIKLAQISAFVRTHSADTPEAVLRGDAKHRTLEEFQSAYQVTFSQATDKHPDPAPLPKADYLRQKGFRYAELIQIEYYNKQLRSLFGETHWNVARQEEFAHLLKQSLRVPRDKQTSDESSSGKLPWDDAV